MSKHEVSMEMNGTTISIETGRMAKQANGSCIVRMGDTMTLMTVTADKRPSDRDFLPLFVEYRNKTYAAGKIPGGFFKREARPTERETLTCRLIDRPLRPLFPDGYRHETQVVAFIISADTDYHADTLSITGASMALALSDVPFHEIVSGVRVADIDGEFVANPSFEQLEESTMDLIVAGTDDIVCMIEGECLEVPEERLLDAIEFAHDWIRKLNALQRELLAAAGGKKKWDYVEPVENTDIIEKVESFIGAELKEAIVVKGKFERAEALSALKDKVKAEFTTEDGSPDPRGQGGLRQGREEAHARDDPHRRAAHRRPRPDDRAADHHRVRRAAPRPRLLPVHPRRDPVPGHRHPGQQAGRAAGRAPERRAVLEQVLPALQLPPVQRGRGGPLFRYRSPRDRPRQAGRARHPAHPAGPGGLPLHHPPGERHPREQRLQLHGHGLLLLPGSDGRRRPRSGPRWPAWPWA